MDSYRVDIELAVKGDLDAKLGGIGRGASAAEGKLAGLHSAFDKFASTVQGVGSRIMGPIDAVASRVAGLSLGFAKLAGAAGIGLATYGVVKLQNEMEKTTISIAAMMSANGLAYGIHDGMRKSARVMSDMRKDAAALPGEFQDLAGIMRTVMIPASHAGMGINDIRKMSSKIMAAGAVAGLPMDQVAREAAMLVEGRAGAHNVFGMRLMGLSGTQAEKFNKSSGEDRVKQITAALDKFAPSIEVFKDSFDGISSTLVDNAKMFLGAATGPLFGKVKGAMSDLNKWFDNNKSTWESYAYVLGSDLARAFDFAKNKMLEWGPVVWDFANNAYSKIAEVWYRVEPVVQRIADLVKGFMSDPAAFDKIERIATIYAGLKVAQVAGGGGLGLISSGLGILGGVKTLGLLGGGAATGAGAGAAGAGAGGAGGAAAGAGIGAIAAPIAVLAAALWGGVAAEQEYQKEKQDASITAKVFHENWDALKGQWSTIMSNMSNAGQGALVALTPVAEVLGVALVGAANAASIAVLNVSSVLNKILGSLRFGNTDTLVGVDIPKGDTRTADQKAFAAEQAALIAKGFQGEGKPLVDTIGDMAKEYKKQSSPKHGGGGGTHIQKVEIVVTSNQDPSRIAREVLNEIDNIKRHPTVSRDVPQWGSDSPGRHW